MLEVHPTHHRKNRLSGSGISATADTLLASAELSEAAAVAPCRTASNDPKNFVLVVPVVGRQGSIVRQPRQLGGPYCRRRGADQGV